MSNKFYTKKRTCVLPDGICARECVELFGDGSDSDIPGPPYYMYYGSGNIIDTDRYTLDDNGYITGVEYDDNDK